MRSGRIDLTVSAGTLGYSGLAADYWSSRTLSTVTTAYFLGFGATTILPSNTNNRYNAFPLRCLSTVLGM